MGIDLRLVPDEVFQMVPGNFQSLSQANFASMDITLDDEITAAGYVHFNNEGDANQSADEFRELVKLGLTMLASTESELQSTVRDASSPADQAFGCLVGLALARQAAESMENMTIQPYKSDLRIHVGVESDLLLTTVFGITGLAQLGSQAETGVSKTISSKIGNP